MFNVYVLLLTYYYLHPQVIHRQLHIYLDNQ